MAGDRKTYEAAMQAGLNLAWEGKWAQALESYKRALAELPDDPTAHSQLGLAYMELGQFDQALEAYHRASQLAPNDPAPLLRLVDIHERLKHPHAAADMLVAIAEIRSQHKAWTEAIQSLQKAIKFNPEQIHAHKMLAEIYTQLDQKQRASKQYVQLARVLQGQNQIDEAMEQCAQAMALDGHNAEARALAEALHLGISPQRVTPSRRCEDGGSPVDIARDQALEELAGIPFEDQPVEFRLESDVTPPDQTLPPASPTPLSRAQIDALIAQAIEFQTRGLLDEAISCYTKVIDAGVDRPAARFNLGLLFQQRLRFEAAIVELSKSVQHPTYALGSHFALGECYRALGRIDDALEHFIEALKIVDLGTVARDQADDLMQLYDALADSYIAKGDRDKALEFTNSLIEFLSSKGWEDKAREARRRIDSLSLEGALSSLAELLTAPDAEVLLSAVSLAQEYVKRGALAAATEVCFKGILAAPTYLPLHLRLAEILVQAGQVDDAVTKFQTVANLYLVRKETRQAINVYKRLLQLMPLDVAAHSRLINLLMSSGEIDEAVEQYMQLADTYFQLAQPDKAIEKYAEALRLTPRTMDEKGWKTRVLRQMADVQARRANWREARQLYLQLLALDPDDDRSHLHTIDLSFKLDQAQQADQHVVALINRYEAQGKRQEIIALLQEATRLQPQQMSLRARLAQVYLSAGLRDQAIEELDTLGELQLDAGLKQQALTTIKFIISLKPRNVEDYQQLLSQI